MAVLDGTEIVHIERGRAPDAREIDLHLHVGTRRPPYWTSMRKVLLAFPLRSCARVLLNTIDGLRGIDPKGSRVIGADGTLVF